MVTLLLLVLSQGPTTTPAAKAWVALGRKQGVAATAASAQVADVTSQLAAAGVPLAPAGDLTSCQRKLACIVKSAREKGVQWVVLVEVARVLEQQIVKLDVISVEEDGRKVASGIYDGPAAQAHEGTAAQVKAKVLPALAALIAVAPAPPPPAPPPAPEPVVVAPAPGPAVPGPAVPAPGPAPAPAPAPAPVEAVVIDTPPPTHPLRSAGFVAAVAGVAGIGTSIALGVLTLQSFGTYTTRCMAPGQCNDLAALQAYNRGASFQDAGVALAIAGGLLLVAGVVLILLGGNN